MACSKESKPDAASMATTKFISKENKQCYFVENGFSSLHPGHPGQTFYFDGLPFKCMRAALLFAKGKAMGDNDAMNMAKRFSHTPSRLRDIEVCATKPNSVADWNKIVGSVVGVVTQSYLDSNPKAVAELMTTNRSMIIIKGEEPEQVSCTQYDLAELENLTQKLEGRNLIGKKMGELRVDFAREEREKQPEFYYNIVKVSERDVIDDDDAAGRMKRVNLFALHYNASANLLDPVMQKRIIADSLDVLLAQLNQKTTVRITVAETDNLIVTEESRQPRDISRGVLCQTIMGSVVFADLAENRLTIQTDQYLLNTKEGTEKRISPKVAAEVKPKKAKATKANVVDEAE